MRRSRQGGEGKPGEGALIDPNKGVGGEGLLRPMLLREPGGEEAPWARPHGGHGRWRQEQVGKLGQEVNGRGGSDTSMKGGWQGVGGQQLEEDSGHGSRACFVDGKDEGRGQGLNGAEEEGPAQLLRGAS